MPTIEEVFKELYIDATEIIPVDSHGMSKHLVYRFVANKIPYVIKVFHNQGRMSKERMAYDVTERMRIPAARVYAFGTLNKGNDYLILTRVLGTTADKVTFENKDSQTAFYESAGNLLSRFHDGIHIENIVNKLQLATGRMTSFVMDAQGDYLPTEDYKDNFIQSVKNDFEHLKKVILEHNRTAADAKENLEDLLDESYQWFMKRIENIGFDDIHFGYCHNDYNESNIMTNAGLITGVMDFETAGFGNTERDVCSLYIKTLHKDLALKQAFFKGYSGHKAMSEDFKDRLSLYLIAECYKKMIWAVELAPDYFQEYQTFLSWYLKEVCI